MTRSIPGVEVRDKTTWPTASGNRSALIDVLGVHLHARSSVDDPVQAEVRSRRERRGAPGRSHALRRAGGELGELTVRQLLGRVRARASGRRRSETVVAEKPEHDRGQMRHRAVVDRPGRGGVRLEEVVGNRVVVDGAHVSVTGDAAG